MDNDKLFAVYALTLVAGVFAVLTATILGGITEMPSPVTFAEHIALSLCFRGAYKSVGGFGWEEWNVFGTAAADIDGDATPPTVDAGRGATA